MPGWFDDGSEADWARIVGAAKDCTEQGRQVTELEETNSAAGGAERLKEKMQSGGERRECEFQLLRYVPDPLRNEYVHIGVILRAQGGSEPAAGAIHTGLAAGSVPGSGGGHGAA